MCWILRCSLDKNFSDGSISLDKTSSMGSVTLTIVRSFHFKPKHRDRQAQKKFWKKGIDLEYFNNADIQKYFTYSKENYNSNSIGCYTLDIQVTTEIPELKLII
jgi:hypothetical protein